MNTIELALNCRAYRAIPDVRYSLLDGEFVFTMAQLEAFRAACVEEAMKWRPMKTAPMSGARFLAIVDGGVRVVAFTKTSHVPIYSFCVVDQGAEDVDVCEPSCWMPLPAEPEVK